MRVLRPVLLVCLALTSLLTAEAAAQSAGPVWVEMTAGVPVGAAAQIIYDTVNSDEHDSYVDVYIHGFWKEDVVDQGTVYQRITVPGLPTTDWIGGPELPAVRLALAVPTDATTVNLGGVTSFDLRSFPGMMLYPLPSPGNDEEIDPSGDPGPGDTTGSDEGFVLDPAIYAQSTPWPPSLGGGPALVEPYFGGYQGAALETYPATWNPTTLELQINAHVAYHFEHPGLTPSFPNVSKPSVQSASNHFINWQNVGAVWQPDLVVYHARYLIIASLFHLPALEPFVEHKKKLGFEVEVAVNLLADQDVILDLIADWYGDGDPGMDHFCLLVGDTQSIPLWTMTIPVPGLNPIVFESDDPYGSILGTSKQKEIMVGRLSVDSPADLTNQLDKIMSYEVEPVIGGDYDEVLLVAHKEEAPGKYEGAQQVVKSIAYPTPPTFHTAYGSQGVSNATVMSIIEADVGLVCYRGHGSTSAWSDWNTQGDWWHSNQVIWMNNDSIQPVVWSISCTNNNIGFLGVGNADCIGEVWMEVPDSGAVAHYGAVDVTATLPNHTLDAQLFILVYGNGIVTHGRAIQAAEAWLWKYWPSAANPWLYMLLGDPSMRIRTASPAQLNVLANQQLVLCDDPPCSTSLDFSVHDDFGAPIQGSMVSLYKPSLIPGGADEVLVTQWVDTSGQTTIPLTLLTPGLMHWSAQDQLGNIAQGEIEITMASNWADLGGGAPGVSGVPALVGTGSLAAGSTATLYLTGAASGAYATLVLGLTNVALPFKGGLLMPNPDVLISGLPVDANGALVVSGVWPGGIPPGWPLYMQYWLADVVAPVGMAGSNGLRGVTP